MEQEIWKDIPGYSCYQASNLGNIRNKNGHILKATANSKGYLNVCLRKDGESRTIKVHRLVYEAFNGPIPEGMQVNHIDENKQNNTLSNLNLMSPSENTNWGSRNDRVCKMFGKWVIKLSLKNEILHFYPSTKKAAKENGLRSNTISECCNGKRKSYGGYTWKFSD